MWLEATGDQTMARAAEYFTRHFGALHMYFITTSTKHIQALGSIKSFITKSACTPMIGSLKWAIFALSIFTLLLLLIHNPLTAVNRRQLQTQSALMISDLLGEGQSLMPFQERALSTMSTISDDEDYGEQVVYDHCKYERMAESEPESLEATFQITQVFDEQNSTFVGKKVEIISFQSQSPTQEQKAISYKMLPTNSRAHRNCKTSERKGPSLNGRLITHAQVSLQHWLFEMYSAKYYCKKTKREIGEFGDFTVNCTKRLSLEHFDSVGDYADYLAAVEARRFTSC